MISFVGNYAQHLDPELIRIIRPTAPAAGPTPSGVPFDSSFLSEIPHHVFLVVA